MTAQTQCPLPLRPIIQQLQNPKQSLLGSGSRGIHQATEPPPPHKSHLKEIIMSAPLPVKVVVISVFCVLATIETTFWVTVCRRYFSATPEADDGEKSLSHIVDDELRKHMIVGQAYEKYRHAEDKGQK